MVSKSILYLTAIYRETPVFSDFKAAWLCNLIRQYQITIHEIFQMSPLSILTPWIIITLLILEEVPPASSQRPQLPPECVKSRRNDDKNDEKIKAICVPFLYYYPYYYYPYFYYSYPYYVYYPYVYG